MIVIPDCVHTLTVHTLTVHTFLILPEKWADAVAYSGKRPPRPSKMDPELWEVIEICWKQDPNERPAMSEVIDHLQALMGSMDSAKNQHRKAIGGGGSAPFTGKDNKILDGSDGRNNKASGSCACIIS